MVFLVTPARGLREDDGQYVVAAWRRFHPAIAKLFARVQGC